MKKTIALAFSNLKVGMLVSCKQALAAFYSCQDGRPECMFTPGMVAIIRAVVPGKPGPTGWPSRVCADFYVDNLPQAPLAHEEKHAHAVAPWRVSIDAANIQVRDLKADNSRPSPDNAVEILAGSLWNSIIWNQREQKGWSNDFTGWPRNEFIYEPDGNLTCIPE